MPLSDTTIRNARSQPGKTVKLSDGGGLQLWIYPTGSKYWNLAYRFESKQRKLALGPYPVVSLREARDRRDEAKKVLVDGRDPAQEKQQNRIAAASARENTFEIIAAELVDKKRREGKTASTVEKNRWLLSLASPVLGRLPMSEISSPQVLAALRPVEARGRLETARRMRAVIGEVFRYAVATGRAQGDPTVALRGALITPKVRHRSAIIDPREFGALLRAIDGHAGMPEVRLALQLLALTFVRPGELRFACWSEFDFDKAIWTIPANRMKMRRPHRVPLAAETLGRLAELRRLSGNRELLIPGCSI